MCLNYNFKNTLVTGAAGCIGSNLTRKLLSIEKNVIAFDKDFSSSDLSINEYKNLKIVTGDLRNKNLLVDISKEADVIFHLAAKVHEIPRSRKEKLEFFEINVEGTRNLLDICVINKIPKFIFFSTVAIFEEKDRAVIDEKSPSRPLTAYSKSKYEAENLIMNYHKEYGIFVSILRLPVVYGPHDKGNVKRLIESIKKGQFRIIGNGKNVKSMVFMENAVDAAILMANSEKANGEIYIVSDNKPYSVNQVAQTIASELGVPLAKIHIPKSIAYMAGFFFNLTGKISKKNFPLSREAAKKLTTNVIYSSEKIKKELGFRPKIGLEEGLAKTIAWYKCNKSG